MSQNIPMTVVENRFTGHLTRLDFDECLCDLKKLEESLQNKSAQVFVSDDETCVQVFRPNNPARVINGSAALDDFMTQYQEPTGTTVINIPQQSSVGPLVISAAGLKCLSSKFNIFPAFYDLVQAFGDKSAHAPRAVAAVQTWKIGCKEECCFLLRHVEEHGRSDGPDPWSIRQIGVYSQTDSSNDTNITLLLNPAKRFQKRYITARKSGKNSLADVETLLLSTCLGNWNAYLDFLETRMDETISSAFAISQDAEMAEKQPNIIDTELRPNDVQTLLYIGQRLELVDSAIASNLEIAQRRQHVIDRSASQRSITIAGVSNNLLVRTSCLKVRLENALQLVSRTLDIQNAERSMQLARRQTKDSRALKTISVLTLLYLPASFVASLLSMNYIHVSQSHPLVVSVDNEFLVFIILTVSLLTITALLWMCTKYFRPQRKWSAGGNSLV